MIKKIQRVGFSSLVCALFALTACNQSEMSLSSPDSDHQIAFDFTQDGAIQYSIESEGIQIVLPSAMGFELKDGRVLLSDFELVNSSTNSVDESWQTVWGQQQEVKNHYNELTLNLKQQSSGILMNVIARAFDDGVAFRYEFPKQAGLDEFIIMDELTQFNFAQDFKAWWGYADYDNYEKTYYTSPISEIGDIDKYARRPDKEERERMCNTPMTLEVNDGLAVCLHEAELVDYPDMSLERNDSTPSLKAHLTPWLNGDLVRAKAPLKSPWRTFQMGSAAEVAASDMLMNLNAPCAYDNTDWISTFKYMGIWWEMHIGKSSWAEKTQFGEPLPANRQHGATTENALRHIDFAAAHGFEEVLVEGWDKGWDDMTGSWTGYGIFDWKTPTDDYDIEKVCQYAKEKGVRIMMYFETISDIDHFEPAMDDLFSMCNRLGITTVKMGYTGDVNYNYDTNTYRQHHHGQYMVRHYNKMVRTAAKYKIMIINHEPIKFTGEQRTYPNLMAREGAKGQEYNAWSDGNSPEHTVVLPFTRLVSGPMDYTPGVIKMDVRSKKTSWRDCSVKSTISKELAHMLTLYSPIQMAADLPENYEGQPALQFIEDMPTDWSQSIVLNGKIGDYYSVARKAKGTDNWYIGSTTDENLRTFDFDLTFLKDGAKYKAIIYADGKDAHWEKNPHSLVITEREVTSKDQLHVVLAPGGGQAVTLVEIK